MRDGSWKAFEKRYKKVFSSFLFLATKSGLILQALLLLARMKEVVESSQNDIKNRDQKSNLN